MTVTTLIENTSSDEHLCAEHGLSLYIHTYANKRYLLDTGASGAFIHNATELSIDINTIDAIIISHNHYDHIGGLLQLLALNSHAKVYIKQQALNGFYAVEGNEIRTLGIDLSLLERHKDRIVWVSADLQLDPDTYLISVDKGRPEFACKDTRLYMGSPTHLVPDSFEHELFVVHIQHNQAIILSSCSHNGIVNIIDTTRRKFTATSIGHIIGGFHLKGTQGACSINCTPAFVEQTAAVLKTTNANIYTGHCTGSLAYDLLSVTLGNRLHALSTGTRLLL